MGGLLGKERTYLPDVVLHVSAGVGGRRDCWSEYSWSCSVTPRFLTTTEILMRGCGWEMHSWKEEKLSVVQMELHVHRDMGQTCRDVQCYLGFRL